MYLHGSFTNQQGDLITVRILTAQDRTEEIEIGAEGGGVYFTDDPVEIADEVNDTFDVLLPQSATVRLLTASHLHDLYQSSPLGGTVNILRGESELIFAGYIEPQQYSQDFNEALDELEINCIDPLSALQYFNWAGVGQSAHPYAAEKSAAAILSFKDIIEACTIKVQNTLLIDLEAAPVVRWDSSVNVKLTDVQVSTLLFFGDDEDGIWTLEDVFSETLRHLNLHARMMGADIYLYNWQTAKKGEAFQWYTLAGGGGTLAAEEETTGSTGTASPALIPLTTALAADTSTQFSLTETYNKLLLTCETKDAPDLVPDPLDNDNLSSPYDKTGGRQKFLTEILMPSHKLARLEGDELKQAQYAIQDLEGINNGAHPYSLPGTEMYNWYARLLSAPNWAFYYYTADEGTYSGTHTQHDISAEEFWQSGTYQYAVLRELLCHPAAFLLETGYEKLPVPGNTDNTRGKFTKSNYLYISHPYQAGDGYNNAAQGNIWAQSLLQTMPLATYAGGTAQLSPVQKGVTNYLLISGKILCTHNGGYERTSEGLSAGQVLSSMAGPAISVDTRVKDKVVKRIFCPWKADKPSDTPVFVDDYTPTTDRIAPTAALYFRPPASDLPQLFEYSYAYMGDSGTDCISKIGVVSCMLIVGDYCLVETGFDNKPSSYEWKKYKTLEACGGDKEVWAAQSFDIGFDPAHGDFLLGKSYDIASNVDGSMNIEGTGIAVPIPYGTGISGKVTFHILGLTNWTYASISRRHETWFRHTSWSEKTKWLLNYITGVYLQDFSIKVLSDNGGYSFASSQSNDVVFQSDTDETYLNKKDDLTFKIHSALSISQCADMGVLPGMLLSNILGADGSPLTGVQMRGREAEATCMEQYYVNDYYQETRRPRILLQQNIIDRPGGHVSPFNLYTHPALPGKTFYVQGIGRNLMEGTAQLTLKEREETYD